MENQVINYDDIIMSSNASSNKVLLEGQGTYTVPNLPGAGQVHATATIAHNYGNNNLLFQVQATTDLTGTTGWAMMPFQSSDGRLIQYASIDSENMYVTTNHNDSSGSGFASSTVNFYYRILVP